MSGPELKVVGEIAPPPYKDPATMLRNIADEIDAGNYGSVETLVVILGGDYNAFFGGGSRSEIEHCVFLCNAAVNQFGRVLWDDRP